MAPQKDDGTFEFLAETDADSPALQPDVEPQTASAAGGVPPPIPNEIDALVNAVSEGGRPRLSRDAEGSAESADPDGTVGASTPLHASAPSVVHPALLRLAAGFVLAFGLGGAISWSVLRTLEPRMNSTAARPRAAATAPAPRATAVPPPSSTVTSPAPSVSSNKQPEPPAAAPTTEPVVEAPRVARAEPAVVEPLETRRTAVGTTGPFAPRVRGRIDDRVEVPQPLTATQVPLPAASLGNASAITALATLPAAARPDTESVVRARVAIDESSVLDTVREYAHAYQAMDVTATAAVWPSVDRRALTRAFATLKSQQLALENCEVSVADSRATARCRGTVEYIRKVGSPTPRTGHQEWMFRMRKLGTEWKIDDVDAAQVSALSEQPSGGGL